MCTGHILLSEIFFLVVLLEGKVGLMKQIAAPSKLNGPTEILFSLESCLHMMPCLCENFMILLMNSYVHRSVKKSLLFRLKKHCHQSLLCYFKQDFHKSCSEGMAITSQKHTNKEGKKKKITFQNSKIISEYSNDLENYKHAKSTLIYIPLL